LADEGDTDLDELQDDVPALLLHDVLCVDALTDVGVPFALKSMDDSRGL
jgi:hypothetical protein